MYSIEFLIWKQGVKMRDCKNWLAGYFNRRRLRVVPCGELRVEIKKAGFTKREFREARRSLGVKLVSKGLGIPEDIWWLPEKGGLLHDVRSAN